MPALFFVKVRADPQTAHRNGVQNLMATPLRYLIVPKDPKAHLFEVTIKIERPDPAGQVISFAAWIPGSYMIRDLARNVISMRAFCNGQDVAVSKIDKSSWRVEPCQGELELVYELFAFDTSVRGLYLDALQGFFDGACVFPAVLGQEKDRCELSIMPPPVPMDTEWRVATSMPAQHEQRYAFGTFAAESYADLIDHPAALGDFHVGEFEAGGIPHAVAIVGEMQLDMTRLCHDLETLCSAQLAFLGRPQDLDRYLFILSVREASYGGLEHRFSSSLACCRKDLPQRDAVKVTEGYRKLLGLFSHEYFHLWNVKRMKPARFSPYELGAESHTGLLWVFEGITSYYDDLFLARSGLISAESYLELLGKTITRVQRTLGRFRQSIEESSFDAWTKLYQQGVNSSNLIISYYSKGALVALALDLIIRSETQGQFSLDDVMHACWDQYGENADGMPERAFEELARNVSGLALTDFFDRYVRGTSDVPLAALLKTVGVSTHFRAADSSQDAGGKAASGDYAPRPWLGASLSTGAGGDSFTVVHAGSPAEKAGLAPGDEAIAFADLRLRASNLDDRLRLHQPGDRVTLTVFRDHRVLELKVRLEKPPQDTCYLRLMDNIDASQAAARADWLASS